MLQGPGKYWIRAACKGKDKGSAATAWGQWSGWYEFDVFQVQLDIADTPDEPDDSVALNGTVNVKAKLLGAAGASAAVNFSVNPAARATVVPVSKNMTVGAFGAKWPLAKRRGDRRRVFRTAFETS